MGGEDVKVPAGLDWSGWLERWERMQELHLPQREKRFKAMLEVVEAAVGRPGRVVDLGCGPGGLIARIAGRWTNAEVVGTDLDGRLLALARASLGRFGSRVRLVRADLRRPGWGASVGAEADAIVSATSLHWLAEEELAGVYRAALELLAPGGVFQNADHVGSEIPGVQAGWAAARAAAASAAAAEGAEDWGQFWAGLNEALCIDGGEHTQRVFGPWRGIEEGLPLCWHARQMAAAGFEGFDCYWRGWGDAVYGAFRPAGR